MPAQQEQGDKISKKRHLSEMTRSDAAHQQKRSEPKQRKLEHSRQDLLPKVEVIDKEEATKSDYDKTVDMGMSDSEEDPYEDLLPAEDQDS